MASRDAGLVPEDDSQRTVSCHDAAQSNKHELILEACVSIKAGAALRHLATSHGGFLNDELRREAWPILLGCQRQSKPEIPWMELPIHRDENQVELDVNRAFVYYPQSIRSLTAKLHDGTDSYLDEDEEKLQQRQQELSSIIVQVLRRYPFLCYFQGFHDIVQVFLLVLGPEAAADAVTHLALLQIRDFMLPSLSPSLSHLQLLPLILYVEDKELHHHLSQTRPFFALSATLTLYAHEIQEYGDIARLFDFLIAQPAVVSIYLFAAVVISRREELLRIPADEPEMLHSILSKLPQPLDLEGLIDHCMMIYHQHPPESLPSFVWWRISSSSVLKTTQAPHHVHSLADGEKLFRRQEAQLRRQEVRRRAILLVHKNRRPGIQLVVALCIGLSSYWLRRKGFDVVILQALRNFFNVSNWS